MFPVVPSCITRYHLPMGRRRLWPLFVIALQCAFVQHVQAGMPAQAEIKLTQLVDITAIKGAVTVLHDEATQLVIVGIWNRDADANTRRWVVFAGTRKVLFEQESYFDIWGGGDAHADMNLGLIAPRVKQPGYAQLTEHDGKHQLVCGDAASNATPLTPMNAADAAKLLKTATFRTSAMVRVPVALARDDAGTYFYVDAIRPTLGGEGYRIFVGKRGAMKQQPLVDVANDEVGMVFATKKGDLRLTIENKQDVAAWVSKNKSLALRRLTGASTSYLIYRELGVYGSLGTLCDDH